MQTTTEVAMPRQARFAVVSGLLSLGLLLAGCASAPIETDPVFIPVPVVVPVLVETVPVHRLPHRPPVVSGPLVCGAGQQACRGGHGERCYTPSAGERCTDGVVCTAGQNACLGPWGASCYTPSRGESCQSGTVCGVGQQVCARGRTAQCYTPSRGETCR